MSGGRRLPPAALHALVFGASAAVLVLEILAGRLLAPYVGVSLETYTGIIGTVLAGIAAGAAVGGRLADRRDARGLLGPTLVLGGALALASLPIVAAVGPGADGGGPADIVLLALTAFFLPAAVLSAVPPLVAKLRLDDLDETGAVVGNLSASSTAGALVGTFLTGFVLVATLPTRPIVIGVGTALVVAGLVLWRLLSATPPAALPLVGVLAAAGLAVVTPTPCEYETAYYCARVEVDPERESGRVLLLDTLRHSYVDLEDPTYLDFRYIRLFAQVVDATSPAGPLDVLHVGGGGFSYPRYLAETRPGTRSTVLELDRALVEIAEDELGLEQGPALRVDVGDARTALADRPEDAVDVVIGDAFGGIAPPWHLTTTEVVRDVERTLRDDGVYVVNIIDGGPQRFVRAEVATLQEVFDEVAVVVPEGSVDAPANHVLVAADRPLRLDDADIAPGDGRVLSGPAVARFVDGARPLTDDFAPVEQLLTRR